jgi:hypothetical protein
LLRQLYAVPRDPEIDERKRRFRDINAYIAQRGGWMTSVPGAREMRFEALPGSPLPDRLRGLGYIVERTGESQRILPNAIVEKFETSSSGALVAAVENSTKPVTTRITHAGLATVVQYDMRLP